jgi:ABC-2 type transport system ATP-binding protein
LDKLTGIYDITKDEKDAGVLQFLVDTAQMGDVISHINQFGIIKLESTPPSLEELFMRHYKKEGA